MFFAGARNHGSGPRSTEGSWSFFSVHTHPHDIIEDVRRGTLLSSVLFGAAMWAAGKKDTVRGTLVQKPGRKHAVRTPRGKLVTPDGDEPNRGVLNDQRLGGFDFEAIGRFEGPDALRIDPIHTRSMSIHRDGKRLMITSWCAVCAIRTYPPASAGVAGRRQPLIPLSTTDNYEITECGSTFDTYARTSC